MPQPSKPTLEWDVVLRDGSTLHLRPFEAGDAEPVRTFFRRLSLQSNHDRFFTVRPAESLDLRDFDSSQPGVRFTLLAETPHGIVAVATYVMGGTGTADCALVVADELQGRGLGTRLVETLADVARSAGVTAFTADTLYNNSRMLEVFRDCGFPIEVRFVNKQYEIRLDISGAATGSQRRFERSRQAATASLQGLFEPKRVAVVGVGRQGGIGAAIFHNLRATFTGDVVPINPHASSIDGVPSYPSLAEVPGEIDLAVVAVPADRVPAAVDSAIAKRVRGLVIVSAGFAEAGAEGRAAQDRILARVRDAGIRLVGPNCMGILNTNPAIGLNATFSPVFPPAGGVAMSTQSGALGLAILDYARELNIGISSFASVGNRADVSSNDLIQYWSGDANTRVILLYLESFGNPRTFARLARHVGRTKPIVSIKAGRSTAGSRAASSHTGALASSDVIVNGLFQQAGIVRVQTLEEMFDVAMMLANQPVPRGRRLGILTNAGGAAILAADTAEGLGLTVPLLAEPTAAALRAFLPPAAGLSNPVDMLASASAADYDRSLRLMLADPSLDAVLVIHVPPLVTEPGEIAAAIVAATRAVPGKPVAATFMRAAGAPAELAPVPCYRFPEAAARAVARAASYAAWRDRPEPVFPSSVLDPAARALIDRAMERGGGWLAMNEVRALLLAAGLPVAHTAAAADVDSAVRAAGDIGYPVALKAVGPTLIHKSDVGGVALGLRNGEELAGAARGMHSRLGDRLTGFLVQGMVPPGVELIVGTVEDESFGPVLLCGLGGTHVELLGTPIARLVPLSSTDVDDVLNDLPGGALLRGYRGAPMADLTAVREVLSKVSVLAEHCPEILEMDLNPVRVFEHGAVIVDARVRVGRPPVRAGRRICY